MYGGTGEEAASRGEGARMRKQEAAGTRGQGGRRPCWGGAGAGSELVQPEEEVDVEAELVEEQVGGVALGGVELAVAG